MGFGAGGMLGCEAGLGKGSGNLGGRPAVHSPTSCEPSGRVSMPLPC